MKIINRYMTALAIGIATSTAYAGIPLPIETVFLCTTKQNKEIQLYKRGNHYIYQFGKAASDTKKPLPELQLIKSEQQVEKKPWPGAGSHIWHELEMKNGKYTYTVFSSYERKPNGSQSAGVMVRRGNAPDINVACDFKQPIIDNLDAYVTR